MAGERLYELPIEYRAVMDRADEAGGELTDELLADLDAIEGRVREKVEKIALWLREEKAWAEIEKLEAARLAGRAASRERRIARLKAFLKENLERMGLDRVETPLCRVRIQMNGGVPAIRWTREPEQIPERFRRVVTVYDFDRTLVRQAAARGEELPGFEVSERGSHLSID